MTTDLADDLADASGPEAMDAAGAWASSPAPSAHPRPEVLQAVAAHAQFLLAAMGNPAVPRAAKAALARSCRGHARSSAVEHALRGGEPAGVLLALAPAITPKVLARYVRLLDRPVNGWRRTAAEEEAARTRLAAVLRAFTRSANPHCRALAAEAFPLSVSMRHQFAAGRVSAPRLAADPAAVVRVALARNDSTGQLEDAAGEEVRRSLLEDADPRVRAAARRAHLHVSPAQMNALLAAVWGEKPPAAPGGPPVPDALDDPDPRVRATAVRGGIAPFDGRRWARVLSDESAAVRAAAAGGYRVPRWVRDRLARDPDARVRQAVARSRWTPPAMLRRLLSDADESVAGCARARDPLSMPVTPPPGTGLAERRPDPLAGARQAQWQSLRLTIAGLTPAQQAALDRSAARDPGEREEARERMISGLRSREHAARLLLAAWEQWGPVLGLTVRSPAWDPPEERLRRLYQQADADNPAPPGGRRAAGRGPGDSGRPG